MQLLGELGPRLRAPCPAAPAMVAVVAVPSLIELGWHGIYTALSRQPDQIEDHHEYWRLLTGSIVQHGGLEGTIFICWCCSSSPRWPWSGGGRYRCWPRRW